MKKLFALLLAFSLTASMFVVPAGAFHVDYVSYSFDFSTNVERIETLHIEKEDGLTEDISVYDEEGNQLYIQVGENEWEKLDTPVSSDEAEKQRLEAEKAAKEAAAKKKSELESKYKVKIADSYAQHIASLEVLEDQIKLIPSALYEKSAAQLTKMGKKLSIIDLTSAHHMSGMAGFYTPSKVTIELDPYGTYSEFPHEYGHLIFMTVLPKFYNSTTLKNEWNALKGGEGPTHVSEYAKTSYDEDLAESFDALISGYTDNYNNIKDMAMEYPDCLAVKKVNFVRDILCKAFSLDKSVFQDITPSVPSPWAKAEIEEYQNILGGSEQSVVPYKGNSHATGYQKPATRLQFVYSIYEDMVRNLYYSRYFGGMSFTEFEKQWRPAPQKVNGKYQIPFTDVDQSVISNTGVLAIHSMYSNGVINGKSATTFDPYGQITRQEAATILYRLCNALGYKLPKGNADNFADSAKIAPWAKDAVAAVSAAGIMNGVGNNNFDPTAVYSCEQSALTLLRTYKLLTK